MTSMNREKQQVHDFWNDASCGEEQYLPGTDRAGFEAHARTRYALEPFIRDLAKFSETRGKKVLEIGVGLGADHQQFAEAGAVLSGIDLTSRAIEFTRLRLQAFGLTSQLATGDAENLAFPDASFDVVYSWGVLHHSPNTPKAIAEVHRVLKPGGSARIMIYHKWSMVGFMLWGRYALARLRPWTPLSEIYAKYLESPGTKAYSVREARELFKTYRDVRITTLLGHGDLLTSGAGQRHEGTALAIARKIWPRPLIRTLTPKLGLFMLIEATK
jgi:ubiquinone/menaquinone biosynthesis C-methylase UbiE